MKYLYILTLSLFITCDACYGQTVVFDTLLNRGKSQFKNDLEKPNYGLAVENLKKATALRPDNAEAHYFLAYAYSRLNSNGAETIPLMQMPLVLKASAELEKVISLTPLYKGEVVTLDPYSKLTSEWAALAVSYLVNNKPDSAAWAFKEGKRRGGFDDFILSINRAVLTSCSTNAILISSGDNFTFPLYYLQTIEKLRKDVSFVDVSTLNTSWCAKFTEKNSFLRYDIKHPDIDTLQYIRWADSIVSIPVNNTGKVFSWMLMPSYENEYITRSDRLFLSILKENKFKRDVYLTAGFVSDQQLSLNGYLLSFPFVDKINANNEQPETINQFIEKAQKILSTIQFINKNSPDELIAIDGLNWEILSKIEDCIKNNQPVEKIKLIKLLQDYLPETKFPRYNDQVNQKFKSLGL